MSDLKFDQNIGLYAISGDCSAYGMTDKSDCFNLDGVSVELISQLLKSQLNWEIESQKIFLSKGQYNADNLLFKEYQKILGELLDINFFHHKWHARTSWILCSLEDNKPVNLPPANVIEPKFRENTYFHVTYTENIENILKYGLLAQVGDRSSKINDEGVFLFPNKVVLEDALSNWLGEELDDEKPISIIEISLPSNWELDSDVGFEFKSPNDIPSEYIEKIYDEDDMSFSNSFR